MIDPAKAYIAGTPGEYAWGGAASTAFWIDPVEDMAVVLLTQLMPSSTYPIRDHRLRDEIMRNTGSIEVRKLHPLFGAEITGIDITRPLSAREFGPIRAAFEEHSVLLFRDQAMDDDTQIAFSENFGPLETTLSANPAAGTKFARQSNLDIMTGEPIPPDDMRMIYQKANYFWHSDSSFKRIPSL
eukprot:gene12709-16185_t